MSTHPPFVYFGTPALSVIVLESLHKHGFSPTLVVTNPDAPVGRKMIMTPSPVAAWATEHDVPTLKPTTLKDPLVEESLRAAQAEFFVVAMYGKIIPAPILALPNFGSLNVHPSLLPKLRGPSPVRTAILENMNPTGVTIMLLTPGMDEGPILAQKEMPIPKEKWPISGAKLDTLLATEGAELLASTIPGLLDGSITPQEQKHEDATYSKMITKEMGLINLANDPYKNLLKIRAFEGWPGTYFFHEKDGTQTRIKIVDAEIMDGKLSLLRVIPEGKNEISYETFLKSY